MISKEKERKREREREREREKADVAKNEGMIVRLRNIEKSMSNYSQKAFSKEECPKSNQTWT